MKKLVLQEDVYWWESLLKDNWLFAYIAKNMPLRFITQQPQFLINFGLWYGVGKQTRPSFQRVFIIQIWIITVGTVQQNRVQELKKHPVYRQVTLIWVVYHFFKNQISLNCVSWLNYWTDFDDPTTKIMTILPSSKVWKKKKTHFLCVTVHCNQKCIYTYF